MGTDRLACVLLAAVLLPAAAHAAGKDRLRALAYSIDGDAQCSTGGRRADPEYRGLSPSYAESCGKDAAAKLERAMAADHKTFFRSLGRTYRGMSETVRLQNGNLCREEPAEKAYRRFTETSQLLFFKSRRAEARRLRRLCGYKMTVPKAMRKAKKCAGLEPPPELETGDEGAPPTGALAARDRLFEDVRHELYTEARRISRLLKGHGCKEFAEEYALYRDALTDTYLRTRSMLPRRGKRGKETKPLRRPARGGGPILP